MCDCSQCVGTPFVFTEIDRTIKPCINLNNASDADNLLSVLQAIISLRPTPFPLSIDGCKSALLCASLDELIAWRRDNNLAPSSDAAAIVNILIPQAALDQIPSNNNNSNC